MGLHFVLRKVPTRFGAFAPTTEPFNVFVLFVFEGGILDSHPAKDKFMPLAVEVQSANHWTTSENPKSPFKSREALPSWKESGFYK